VADARASTIETGWYNEKVHAHGTKLSSISKRCIWKGFPVLRVVRRKWLVVHVKTEN